MALVQLVSPIQEIRGRMGGLVFSHCGLTHTVTTRRITKPRKKTARTEEKETDMSKLSKMWYGQLTPEQRAAWENYANKHYIKSLREESFRMVLPFGRQGFSYLTGYTCFIRVNMRLLAAAYSLIFLPPPKGIPPVFIGLPTVSKLEGPLRILVSWDEILDPWIEQYFKNLIYVRKLPHGTWYRIAVVNKGVRQYTITEYRGAEGKNIPITKGQYQIKMERVSLDGTSTRQITRNLINIQ